MFSETFSKSGHDYLTTLDNSEGKPVMKNALVIRILDILTGKHTDAWQILTKLEEAVPGMVMVAMRRISLERRIGDKEKTEMLFQEYIDKAGIKNVRAFYAIKYARYLFKVGLYSTRVLSCFYYIIMQSSCCCSSCGILPLPV